MVFLDITAFLTLTLTTDAIYFLLPIMHEDHISTTVQDNVCIFSYKKLIDWKIIH